MNDIDHVNDSNYLNDTDVNEFRPGSVLVMVLIFTAMILIIVGNLIVIVVFHYTPSLRNPTSVFITSLAFADLGVGISCSFSIQAVFTENWPYSIEFCMALGFFLTVVVGVSIMTLGCISVDRYIAITRPLKYYTIVTKKRARLMSMLVWIFSVLIFMPSLFGWGSIEYNEYTYDCRLHWSTDINFSFYVICTLVTPNMIISSFCYFHIFKVCKKHAKKIKETENLCSSMDSGNSQERDTSRKRHERAIAKIFVVIMSAFYITWLPFICIRIIEGTSEIKVAPIISFLAAWMGIFNSFLNCLIYSLTHEAFRVGFKSLLKSTKNECNYYCVKYYTKCLCCKRV